MKQVYGLVCSIALTGKAEFAQLLFVPGCLLCMAAMVAALLSPTFGHPQVPREQASFPRTSLWRPAKAHFAHRCWILTACGWRVSHPFSLSVSKMDFQTLQALFGWSK